MARGFYEYAAKALRNWNADAAHKDAQWVRSGRSGTKARERHCWDWDPVKMVHRCTRCLRWTRGAGGQAKSGRCRPVGEGEKGNLVRFSEKGHKLWQIRGPRGRRMVIFCAGCGCYVVSGRGVGLNQPCKDRSSGQKARLRKLSRGQHPVTGQLLGEVTGMAVAA